jgi:hypothetical protein
MNRRKRKNNEDPEFEARRRNIEGQFLIIHRIKNNSISVRYLEKARGEIEK